MSRLLIYPLWMKIFLGCVIVMGFGLRFIYVSDIPPGLNRDEAAIGYTAFSILKTGKDEYGGLLPLSLKSFGDWKLPGYVYASIPSVILFGLTEFAVRFPSVIFGTATIFLTYLIAKELFSNKEIALISATLIALSPWHVFFSRVASEANMAVFLSATAFYCYLKARTWPFLFILGSFVLILTLVTYHGNHVFTPLFFILILFYFRNQVKKRWLVASSSLFGLAALFIFSQTLFSSDKTKISGLLSVNDPSLVHEKIVKNRLIYSNTFVSRVFNNKLVFFVEDVAGNYIKSFSPEFIFISGGGNNQHNIPDFGNMYLIEAFFILLGGYLVFLHREKSAWLLLAWILISPIGASLTKDAPHSARMIAIFPSISLVTAYGIYTIVQSSRKRNLQKIMIVGLSLLYLGNVSLFLSRYFVLFPYKAYADWGGGQKEMVNKLRRIKANYKEVVISKPERSPYIYYLFYQLSDPAFVQQTIVRYPPTDEGFEHVKAFDGIQYKKINWSEELQLPGRLYIDLAEGVPSGATNSAIIITEDNLTQLEKKGFDTRGLSIGDFVTSRVVDTVVLPDHAPLFYFIETRIGTAAAQLL